MRKEPVMTESKGQRCLLERTCYVTSTGEIHELKGPEPTRAYTLVELKAFDPAFFTEFVRGITKQSKQILLNSKQ